MRNASLIAASTTHAAPAIDKYEDGGAISRSTRGRALLQRPSNRRSGIIVCEICAYGAAAVPFTQH